GLPRSAARCRSRPAWSRRRCTSCTSSASTRPGCAAVGAAARSPPSPRTIPPRSDAPTTRCFTAARCTCVSGAPTRGSPTPLAARGHEVVAIPATRLQSEVDEHGDVHVLGPEGVVLDRMDLLLVRGLPRGSLEQVIFRVDALHVLAAHGVRVVNRPRALERTIDKSWAGAVLAGAGIPTPATIVCERY